MRGRDDLAVVGLPAVVRELLRRRYRGEVALVRDGRVPAETLALGIGLGVLEEHGPHGHVLPRLARAEAWLKREDKARKRATVAKRLGGDG